MSDTAQWWLVYVKWDTGQRETIRTTRPADVVHTRCWIMACLPVARMSVQAFTGYRRSQPHG